MAAAKASALTLQSVSDALDILYSVDVSDTTDGPGGSSRKQTYERFLGMISSHIPSARLTTESGVPVSTSDRTGQGTLYWKPQVGSIPITTGFVTTYDGTRRKRQEFTQQSLSLSLTSGKNYDVFQKNSDLSLVLSNAWTNDTTRADALAEVAGLPVANSDNTYLWIGTIRADGTNTVADSGGGGTSQVGGKRFVWNVYNRVRRTLAVKDTTDSWSYTTGTFRQMNAAAGNKVEWVTGDASSEITARSLAIAAMSNNSARALAIGIGLDSTSASSGFFQAGFFNSPTLTLIGPISAGYTGQPGLGYHYLAPLEYGADGTCTFYGDNGGSTLQSGLQAEILG